MSDATVHRRPDAPAVALRALALATLVDRGVIEHQTLSENSRVLKEAQADIDERMIPWMRQEGVWAALSPKERALFERRLGFWSHQDLIDASWRNESLGVMLWAIGRLDSLTAYDCGITLESTMSALPLGGEASIFVHEAELRPGVEISHARDVAELWHWRCRTQDLIEGRLDMPEGWDAERLYEVVQETTRSALQLGELESTIDGDFCAFGKAFADLDEAENRTIVSITMERHYALNWLCGYAENWDEVPTDT
jgi:hypothetical protein